MLDLPCFVAGLYGLYPGFLSDSVCVGQNAFDPVPASGLAALCSWPAGFDQTFVLPGIDGPEDYFLPERIFPPSVMPGALVASCQT